MYLFVDIYLFGIFLPAIALILGFALYQDIPGYEDHKPKIPASPPGDCPAAAQPQSADQPEGKNYSTSPPSHAPCYQLTSI